MNKKAFIIIAAVLLVLAAFTVGYYVIFSRSTSDVDSHVTSFAESYTLSEASHTSATNGATPEADIAASAQEVAHDPEADAFIASLGKMGEDYTLHSQEFEQGDLVDETIPSLGWNGDMILRMHSATVKKYAVDPSWEPDAHEDYWETEASMMKEPMILTLDLSLTNKDAKKPYGVQYDFDVCMFRLSGYRDVLPESKATPEAATISMEYAGSETAFSNPGEGKKYYSFELPEGETMDFTMKYLIDREYLNVDTPFLAIAPGRVPQAGILLDNIQEE